MELRVILNEEIYDEENEHVASEESLIFNVSEEDVYFASVILNVKNEKARYEYVEKWANYSKEERKAIVARLIEQQGEEIKEFFKADYLAKHAI